MRRTLFFLAAVSYCATAFAGKKKADRLFDSWEYFRASVLYEKELAVSPSPQTYFKLAECYMKMNDYGRAEYNFSRVAEAGIFPDPQYYFDYAMVLKSTGKYEEAKREFEVYIKLKPKDKRGSYYLQSCDIAIKDNQEDLPVMVTPVDALNTKYGELSPALYQDGIVFTSSRGTKKNNKIYGWTGNFYPELFFARRGSNDTSFGPVAPLKEFSRDYQDGPACFSNDFGAIYFSRVERTLRGEKTQTLGIEKIKIYTTEIKDGKWGRLKGFFLNNDSFSVACPFLSHDGNRLYFVSDMPGGYGETDVWYCSRTENGWSKPRNMGPNVNTFGKEKYPYEDAEGNFYFSSDGYQGFGGLDICVAANKNGVLQPAKPLKEPLNSPGDDFGIVSLDGGKTGYFTSNRAGGQGNDDIYYFDMAGGNSPVKAYTIGYKPKGPEVAEVKKRVDTPVIKKVKEAPIKKEEVLAPRNSGGIVYKHDTFIVTHSVTTRITTTETDDIFDVPGEDIHIPDDKDNPSFGLPLHFDVNKYTIRPDDYPRLITIADWLKMHPKQEILVEGHTDTRASEQQNMQLSGKRAMAAVDFLAAQGIARSRMTAIGFGYYRLINFCNKGRTCPELMQEANRRVEFRIKKKIEAGD